MAADTTDRLTPLELTQIRLRCERHERALRGDDDTEAVVAATASAVDAGRLLPEVEALRKHIAELRTGSLHRLVGLVPSGPFRNLLAAVVVEVERELRKDDDTVSEPAYASHATSAAVPTAGGELT